MKNYTVSFRYGFDFGQSAFYGVRKEYYDYSANVIANSKIEAFTAALQSFAKTLTNQEMEKLTYIGKIVIGS